MKSQQKKFLKNEIITAEITDIHREGNGVAKYGDLVIFTPGVAMGDICRLKIVKVKSGYCFAKCIEVLKPSPERTDPPCPYFGKCGGCQFMNINYREEKRLKNSFVNADFNIREKIGCEVAPILSCEKIYGYRNKARFPVRRDPEGNAIAGFFAPGSHRLIQIDKCLLQNDKLNEIACFIVKKMNRLGIKGYNEDNNDGDIRHIYLRIGEATGEIMVCLVCTSPGFPGLSGLCDDVCSTFPRVSSFCININRKRTNVIMGDETFALKGKETINDTVAGINCEISPAAFYQVNRDGAEKIYAIAGDFLNPDIQDCLLDMYCGAGIIGLSMAKNVNSVTGVEIIPDAVKNAKKNADKNGIYNAKFLCRDASEAANKLKSQGYTPTEVVVDPPRKGCGKDALNAVISLSPQKIAMISCNSATAASDCRFLVENGYSVNKVQPFDMFPRTKHVECIILLTKDSL